ncbi:diguanylate cyclase domain-containing protein [Dactylosporangium sp. CS-047395]|uniref:diguanylate cyclase domain-containing protein n=1 Tax=Dactylosporangium sp. CS-047395 TaxID=3239936 RepID=UPI003D92EE6F
MRAGCGPISAACRYGFRAVNEAHGHQAGDELLIGVAHRLRDAAYAGTRTAPHCAVTARLGGDDFAVPPAGRGRRGRRAPDPRPPRHLRPAVPDRRRPRHRPRHLPGIERLAFELRQ